MKKKILVTAKQRGSVEALIPIVEELKSRCYELTVYATGNEKEATGFGTQIKPKQIDYSRLVKEYDFVLVGLSGTNTPDYEFVRAANKAKIPVVAVLDQNSNYQLRFGDDVANLPTLISMMNDECIDKMKKELKGEILDKVLNRTDVIGWTAFDDYGKMKKEFTPQGRIDLLTSLGLDPDDKIYFHATQNLGEKKEVEYELRITQAVFRAASDLHLKLVVKPHPREESDNTKDLTEIFNFAYIHPKACDTKQLMLASYSVTASLSTCLTQACLFDKNTGGIIPDINDSDISTIPPIVLGAIPYAQRWETIDRVMQLVTSTDEKTNLQLAQDRKKFYVDGNASKRLVDRVEKLF